MQVSVISAGFVIADDAALVKDLPGLNFQPNFNSYSGYLNGGDGNTNLHYWFVESQSSKPDMDPLVLWLNGGPGCSSLDGLLTELGPFRISDDSKSVVENVYAWNKIANIIFLESPGCVGFSYTNNSICNYTDEQTAAVNHDAIVDFLQKFPKYKKRNFYVAGESYGGIYVPTVSVLFMKDETNFPNYMGSAIGNGFTDDFNNANSLAYFVYQHGLIHKSTWDDLWGKCKCDSSVSTANGFCNFMDFIKQNTTGSQECEKSLGTVSNVAWVGGNDPYNLYAYCYQGNERKTQFNNFLAKKYSFLSEILKDQPPIPCTNSFSERDYLNRKDVKDALHISDKSASWTVCSSILNYDETVDSTIDHIKQLVNGSKHVLMYNGDVDMACNYFGDEIGAAQVGQEVLAKYQPWMYGDNQVAGYVIRYKNLDFMTVKGSGHFVPSDRPGQALQMFYNFLTQTGNYSAPDNINVGPLPLNGQLKLTSSFAFIFLWSALAIFNPL